MSEGQQKKTLGMAIASLVFGCFLLIPLLGLVFSIPAIILGIIALVKIGHNKETLKGSGLAIAGIILGAIGIIIIPIYYQKNLYIIKSSLFLPPLLSRIYYGQR